MFGIAGQIFQFVARSGYVDNYGFNFTLRHPLNLWKPQNDTFEDFGSWPEVYWVEAVSGRSISGTKQASGRSIIGAEVFFRLKCASGRSILGAKVSVGLKWSWGQTGCEPRTNLFYGVFAVLSFLIYDQATSIKLFSGYNYSSQAKQWTYKFYIELYFLYCWFN